MARFFTCASLVVLGAVAASGQSAEPAARFDIADVHVSARADWVKKSDKQMQGGLLNAGRYELRRATMLDLIRIAYTIDADKVYGGPNWLDYDRFEVIAKAPAGTRPDALKRMLQALLADRFALVVKSDNKPVPAFVLSAGKGQPKLKPAEGADSGGCRTQPSIQSEVITQNIQCRGVTMEAFAAALRGAATQFTENLPVVDSTGIEGRWDIDLKYPLRVLSAGGGNPPSSGTMETFLEAIDKQLGLKLERGTAPQPVLMVASVNEAPSANPRGVSEALPALPPPVFEVASLRPCDGKGPNTAPRFELGGRVTAHCMFLANMMRDLWGLAPFEELTGAPKWLTDGHSPGFSIEAKAPAGNYVDAQGRPDRDALNAMLRALLVDRFQIKFHYEDRPVDAQTLVAVKPKLTKADAASRTGCTRHPAPQAGRGAPMRLVCQNMTMAQFAEQLQAFDTQMFYPVVDSTGIEGAWDFAITYDAMAGVPLPPVLAGRGPAPEAGEASDPSGAVPLAGAIEKQLGLRLEKHKRSVKLLVIDHVEEKATDN